MEKTRRISWIWKSLACFIAAFCLVFTVSSVQAADSGNALKLTTENIPEKDVTLGNQLPLTGYLEQTITVGSGENAVERTAKVYLAENAPIRPYFTVLNTPEGIEDTWQWLQDSGWKDIADQMGEGLFVLEPGKDGWGSAGEEYDYVCAAMAAYKSNQWYSVFGQSYVVGYDDCGTAMQEYVMRNSLSIIGSVFVNASDLNYSTVTEIGNTVCRQSECIEEVTLKEVPMPVWLINSKKTANAKRVIRYWENANDCVKMSYADGTYKQREDSDSIVTSYSDARSKVIVDSKEYDVKTDSAFAKAAYKFLGYYTRYEGSYVNGNALGERADYEKLGIELKNLDQNGVNREYLVYVPEGAEDQEGGAPVVYVAPGGSQTDRVFLDATQWWRVAQENQFILVIMNEQMNGATKVTWNGWNGVFVDGLENDFDFFKMVIAEVDAAYKTNTKKRYFTGQSQGSGMTNFVGMVMPEYFAALGGTSGTINTIREDASELMVPFYQIVGENDMGDIINNLSISLPHWLEVNGLADFDNPTSTVNGIGRVKTAKSWNNSQGIPLVRYRMTTGRNHNCIPSEMFDLWSWFKAWEREENGDLFFHGTKVETTAAHKTAAVQSLDEMDPPALDNSVPNRLPMTGYYSKSVTTEAGTRTAKVYIAEETKIRPYFTIIAVPDGVNTEEFLTENGWFAEADANKEGLFILEPGKDGWGSPEEEKEYINGAIAFCSSNKYFSVYGEHYFAGYGKGGAALEYWAAANPLKVIGQVYVDSDGLDKAYLEEIGETVFPTKNGNYNQINFPEDFELLKYKDAVLPTWYIGGNPEDSLSYWKSVNDCQETAEPDDEFGSVFAQKEDSTRWMTDYAGPISKVAVETEQEASAALTEKICDFLYAYTRYENGFAYSNGLYERIVYGESCYKVIDDVNGHPREYMVYEPENMQENAPVMFVFPGNTQTDLVFMDATQWQDAADQEGFLLVMVCEDYNTSTTVTFKDSNEFQEKLAEQIKKDYAGRIDPERFYANGQSMGGMTVQGFGATNPDYFAAIATTSGCLMDVMTGDTSGRTYEMMPVYMIYGAGDNVNFSGTLWDDTDNQLDDWARYYTEANGVSLSDVAEADGTVKAMDRNNHRTQTTWTWSDTFQGVEVPLMKLGKNSARAHNCLPIEEFELYEFAKHYRAVYDENGIVKARYYSASAFEQDDDILIYEASEEQIVSTKGFTDATKIGQKLTYVAIEYSDIVDAASLRDNTFTIRAYKNSNKNLAYAEITAVYTNDKPETREDQKSVPGKYVIVETKDDDYVGTKWIASYYYEKDGKEAVMSNGILDVEPLVHQKKAVKLENGTIVPRSKEAKATEKTEDLKFQNFETITIPSDYDQLEAPFENEIIIQYCLPENYDESRKYPLVISMCGGGLRLDEQYNSDGTLAATNQGANLCYDSAATAWVTAKEDGYIKEDVIVMSVNYRSVDRLPSGAKYFAPEDTNQGVRYIRDHFSVDPNRIYYSGNSFGSLTGYEAISKAPELYAAFMPCNGLAIMRIDTSTEEGVQNMMKIISPLLNTYAENHIAIKWNLGEKDFMAPPAQGIYYYEYMVEQYYNQGMTEEEIAEILNWTIYGESEYVDNGILNQDGSINYHLATKVTYEVHREEAMNWLLKQNKTRTLHLELD
ncbi:MAG: PHB depolymerase family esterase, partial [Clostridiales bacterium]|nr:PHB depolymerase family esterase [Clostridiales bacterium]